MSGGPRFAVLCPPGTRKAIEMCSKMLGWSLVIFPVGPKKTDQMSTHGMIDRDQRRPGDVLEVREEPEAEQDEREQLRQVEEDVEVGEPRPNRDRDQRQATTGNSRGMNASGSSRRTSASVAGMRTSAMKRTSGQRPALHRWSAPAVYAAIAAVRPASASARRGPPSRAAILATRGRAP